MPFVGRTRFGLKGTAYSVYKIRLNGQKKIYDRNEGYYMTEKIYERDCYCKEFKAKVLSCSKDDSGYNVVLDRTAFFPEGGGQAADLGEIDNALVLDVQVNDGVIVHKTDSELAVGAEVAGKIDWDLRFSRMQSHAGEHIVSGVIHNMFGYSNVGFHMGNPVMTVDIDGPLTLEDIEKIEIASNKAVYENAPITISFPTEEELKTIDYRSKIDILEGTRLVKIGDVDCCACCAPHPSRTGEIGVIKIINFSPYKKGTRIEMIAGISAFLDYSALNASNGAVMATLSAPRAGIAEAVARQAELIKELKTENQRLSKSLALYELKPTYVGENVYSVSKNLSYDELGYCAKSLTERGAKICILLSKNDDENFIYVVSSQKEDARPIVKTLNTELNGKGGGKPDYAQGKISPQSEDAAREVIEQILRKEI